MQVRVKEEIENLTKMEIPFMKLKGAGDLRGKSLKSLH